MPLKLGMKKLVLLSALLLASSSAANAQSTVERPPQFVLMAFDNCTELERWKELTEFADDMNRDRDRVHFTFFVSGVNFIADASRSSYEGPRQRRGQSMINFGGTPDQVRKRVDYINGLFRSGHEIGSHAVGHFKGASWSAAEWGQEFLAFNQAFKDVAKNNGLADDVRLDVPLSRVVGFRAPYLATSPGLYTVLKANGFRYDTSGNSASDAWPVKTDDVWRFNLARLKLFGSGRSALSMDYNFFVAHSRAGSDPKRIGAMRDQIVQTYLEYFKTNYAGNRAPLHIGHHFFDYNGGAYKEALKIFAKLVCGLPEVRCATYAALADFMDGQSAEVLAAYRKGDFPRVAQPTIRVAEAER